MPTFTSSFADHGYRSGRAIFARLGQEPVKWIVLGLSAGLLFAVTLYPMTLLVKFAFWGSASSPSLGYLASAFLDPGMARAMSNTLWLTFFVTIGANAIGLPLAWCVSRTDIPLKGLLRLGATLAFVIPSFITVIAWLFLASPNSGLLNKIIQAIFGNDLRLLNIVSFGGLVWIEVTHLYPIVFFLTSAALSNIDPHQENAARVLGAGRLRTAVSITLPLVMPAIVSASMLVMLDTLSSFGAPAAIGTMANFSVLTTKIYELVAFPPNLALAAATSLPIVIVTLLCLLAQRALLGSRRYVTVNGKTTNAQAMKLGRWRKPVLWICLAVISITTILPLAGLLLLSTSKTFGSDLTVANLTMNNFTAIFSSSQGAAPAIWNSFWLASVTAVLCIFLGFICAWFVERTRHPTAGMVSALIMIIYGFPSIAFAVAIMLGYIDWLYGTFTIILIAYVGKNLPISFVLFSTTLKQLSTELEEAARISGASWLSSVFRITLPLLRMSIWAAGLLIFSAALRELTMSAILSQPSTEVMATRVLGFLESGSVELAAAVASIIVAISLLALVVMRLMTKRGVLEIH